MKPFKAILLSFFVLFTACNQENNEDSSPPYQIGKNRFTLSIDGDEREYYVHVPGSYSSSEEVPVVFMLHGTSGDGLRFYNISGWKEVGEKENILTVFPSSWRYCIIDGGQEKNTTKWTMFPESGWTHCAGEIPRDDIGFLRAVVEELKTKFDVDEQRIYLAGFSNGGKMAFRAAVEMSDVFAAIAQNSGTHVEGETFSPIRNIPLLLQFGNFEDGLTSSQNSKIPIDQLDRLLEEHPVMANVVQTNKHF